jgi:dihydroneopterin aldolase
VGAKQIPEVGGSISKRPADRVLGRGMRFPCRIGFYPAELGIRQEIEIDFEAETDWRPAALRDEPRAVVDYAQVHRKLAAKVAGGSWNLIEALAEELARLICTEFAVSGVRVRVTKRPLDLANVEAVAVECWRCPADFQE